MSSGLDRQRNGGSVDSAAAVRSRGSIELFPDSAISGDVQGEGTSPSVCFKRSSRTRRTLAPFLSRRRRSALQGTWRQLRIIGDVAVRGARVQVAALGSVTFDSINAHVQLRDHQIVFDSLRAHSGGTGHGTHAAMLHGSVEMPAARTGWSQLLFPSLLNLTFTATDFAVFNNRLARVDIQTGGGVNANARSGSSSVYGLSLTQHDSGVHLIGPLDSATLSGNLTVLNSCPVSGRFQSREQTADRLGRFVSNKTVHEQPRARPWSTGCSTDSVSTRPSRSGTTSP